MNVTLWRFTFQLNNKLFKIIFAMQRDKMMNNFYVDLVD